MEAAEVPITAEAAVVAPITGVAVVAATLPAVTPDIDKTGDGLCASLIV